MAIHVLSNLFITWIPTGYMKDLFLPVFVHLDNKFFSISIYILKMDLLSHVYGMFLLEQVKTECMVVTFQWKVYK